MTAKEMIQAGTEQASVLALYSREQIAILRNNVADPKFSDGELAYCLTVARARNLDPFKKQVYFAKRRKRVGDGWADAVQVEPTIDGYRSLAEATGELDGYEGPFWCGDDGIWRDAWLSSNPPVAAKITVFRKGRSHGFTGVARFSAYVQTAKDNAPNHIWAKMGDNQLAKCAESLALRKAFPGELGDMYTREEMEQAEERDRFASLPQERPQIVHTANEERPKALPQKASLPALPDRIDTIPVEIVKVFATLGGLEGVPIVDMSQDDLELVLSVCRDNKPKVKTALAKQWLGNIEARALEVLDERGGVGLGEVAP